MALRTAMKAGRAAKKAGKAINKSATTAKKDKPKTFESEMKELRGITMTDPARQAAKIKLAKKYNKTITIDGKTFGPKSKTAKKTKASMEAAEKKRKAAGTKSKKAKDKAAAKVVEKKGSIAKKMTVSQTDIKQAKTANEFDALQRRIDAMPDGNIKRAMQKMLDAQRKSFEKMQASELDRAGRKSAQANRDRAKFKGYTPKSPFAKGGVVKGKSRTGHTDMRMGGIFYK